MIIQLMFSSLSLILIVLFPFLTHPLSMGAAILMLTLILAVSLGLMSVNFWVSYMLIMVLLGGLLVIFIYISLLAPNEIFTKGNLKKFLGGSGLLLICLVYLMLKDFIELKFAPSKFQPQEVLGLEWLSSLYSTNLGYLTIFLILYLFLTLIVVVFITKFDMSSLRSTTK